MLNLDTKLTLDAETIKSPNLTTRFSAADLSRIGAWVYQGYQQDKASRSRWERRNEAGMDLALQIQKAKSFPWPGCANVAFPLVTIAAMQFHARAYPAIISGTEVAKCRVIGEDPAGEQASRAERVQTHMSWQCLEEDVAWEEQHDRGLLNLAIVGCNFVKTYYKSSERHQVSELVLAKDLVLDYYAKSVETCGRKTQLVMLSRNQIYERVMRGSFRNVKEESWFHQPPVVSTSNQKVQQDNRQGIHPPNVDELTPYQTLEQHVNLDLDQDGYAEPYIITVEETSQCVLRIITGCERPEDVERNMRGEVIAVHAAQYFTKYSFIPSPDGGIYDIGFGVLLGPLNDSVNTAINQLFDAGTQNTLGGGFLGRGAKLRGGIFTVAPNQWQRIDATGDDLRKSIVPFPKTEPSSVLFNLLQLMIDYTNRISGATDMMVGENPGQNTPAYNAQAMLEQGQKIYAAIFKRVWRSMKEEFRKRYVLNAIHLPATFRFGTDGARVLAEDYLGDPNSIAPAADPQITSDAQKFTQAQAVKASAIQTPGYDQEEVEKFYLRALKVPGYEKLYVGVQKAPPGKSEKVQIAEMQLQQKQQEFQGKMQLEAAQLQLDARDAELKAQQLQIEIQLKMVELQGDVQDREVQRMNAMVSMLKSQADQARAKADILIAHLESMGHSAENLRTAQEQAREDTRLKADIFLKSVKVKQDERKLEQKDKELEIKDKVASRPKAAA